MTTDRDDPVRHDLKALLRAVGEVFREYPDMDLGQFLILLHVAVEPGIAGRDLLARIGMKKSTLSRNVRLLSTVSYLKDDSGNPRDGYMLIAQIEDPSDARFKQLAPTRKLWTLVENMTGHLRG